MLAILSRTQIKWSIYVVISDRRGKICAKGRRRNSREAIREHFHMQITFSDFIHFFEHMKITNINSFEVAFVSHYC